MKLFESFLADKLEEFISYRQSLGLKNSSVRSYLRCFDRYIIGKKAEWADFIPMFFLDFQDRIPGEKRTVNTILSAVHGFFEFLVRREYLAENPLQDIPPRPENRFIPFIFAPKEVERLLRMIQERIRKTEQYFFRDYTVYMAILLIARCGLRISEPLRLHISSYRPKERTIYIEKTKFHKDRLIPVQGESASELDNYLELLRRFSKNNNRYLFPGIIKGRGLTENYIYPIFHQTVKDIGLARQKQIVGTTTFGAPTVHYPLIWDIENTATPPCILKCSMLNSAIIWSILPSPTRRNCDPYPMSASVLQLLPAEDKRGKRPYSGGL